jgi:hypothetical protein
MRSLVRAAGVGVATEEPLVGEVKALVGRVGEGVDRAPRNRSGGDDRGEKELTLRRLDRGGAACGRRGLGLVIGVGARAVEMELGAGLRLIPLQKGKRPARRRPGRGAIRGRRTEERRERGIVLSGERIREGQDREAEDERQGRERAVADQSSSLAS